MVTSVWICTPRWDLASMLRKISWSKTPQLKVQSKNATSLLQSTSMVLIWPNLTRLSTKSRVCKPSLANWLKDASNRSKSLPRLLVTQAVSSLKARRRRSKHRSLRCLDLQPCRPQSRRVDLSQLSETLLPLSLRDYTLRFSSKDAKTNLLASSIAKESIESSCTKLNRRTKEWWWLTI